VDNDYGHIVGLVFAGNDNFCTRPTVLALGAGSG
jgi:hypothetical protein